MIDAVREKSPALADKMKVVLDKNCARLEGLSPAAVEHSKKIIHYVTGVQCGMTLEKDVCHKEAAEIRKAFQVQNYVPKDGKFYRSCLKAIARL